MLPLTILSACDNYLDKNPLDAISSDTFWKSEADIKMALAGCYGILYPFTPLGFGRSYLDCIVDGGYAQWGFVNWDVHQLAVGQVSPTVGSLSPTVFSTYYRGIASLNYFLDNISKAQGLDPALLNKYIGEVKFLRALVYFDLVNFYGDVILYKTSPTSPDDAKVAKTPKKDVLAFIHEDLDFAASKLPNTAYSGHAIKGSALALKARVLIYEENWSECAKVAKQIIDDGKFRLYNNYENLFLPVGQENNPEIMFSTVYLGPNLSQGTAHITNNNRAANIEFGWGSHICPYPDLVDAYDCTDGKSISQSPLYNAAKPWLNRDPRLAFTIRMPNVTWPAGEPSGAPSLTGVNMQKYVDLSKAPFSYSFQNQYDGDYIHIRYADVLLMYAEAQNELSGPDPTIFAALDQIRGREGVAMPKVDQKLYTTKESLRDFIRHERRIELALEGQRYFDLKRWHIAHLVVPKLATPGGVPLVFQEKHYLLPFPQSEIDINPALVQNPGY